jgi:hypothetical protein
MKRAPAANRGSGHEQLSEGSYPDGSGRASPRRIKWPAILEQAADIVRGYDTGVTLRQLFYRLVAAEILPNTRSAYSTLSAQTAAARRDGAFPALMDRTRTIHEWQCFDSPGHARRWLASIYRRDRTEGQDWSVYVGVEKNGLVEQVRGWFGDLGIPILALGGYSSQTYVDEISRHVKNYGRDAVLVYAGDFDASGEDITRDFIERTDCFEHIERVALNAEQVEEYDLPPQLGKETDTRARSFIERHGELVQVEVDALPPDTLKQLFEEAIERYFDFTTYEEVIEREERERDSLTE